MQLFVQSLLTKRTLCVHLDDGVLRAADVQAVVAEREGISEDWFHLVRNGRRVDPGDSVRPGEWLLCASSLPGGKGGFGSMLRAIGAQIEKTTNREACRDLSGRRLRDINHETRLKRWVARQAEREAKKVRRPLDPPKHTLDDPEYQKQRDMLPDRVQEAVSHGLNVGSKRPGTDVAGPSKKRHRAPPLWLGGPEMPEVDSSEEEQEGSDAEPQPSPGEADNACQAEPHTSTVKAENTGQAEPGPSTKEADDSCSPGGKDKGASSTRA